MMYLFLSLVIGVSAATLVWAIFALEKNLSPNTLRRLDKIKRKSNVNLTSDSKVDLDLSLQNPEFRFQFFGNLIKDFKFTKKIKDMIQLTDLKWEVDTFLFFSFACALIPLVFLVTQYKLMALFSLIGLLIPFIYVKQMVDKRFQDFAKQFPDALNLMASSLRAGHPLFSAIDIVTTEMPKPISDVFESAKRDISLGADTKDAFYGMTKIMPNSIDLRFFITAVLIQKEVGGNLAELLDALSETIRERFKLLGQLRVQTAQTRISGIVLGIVPVGVLLVVFFLNPEYIKPMFETPDGQIALAISIVLIIAGFVSIKKISSIEI